MKNKIAYGQWVFANNQIQNANVFLTTSLLSDSLEANTFTADVECKDKSIVNFERNTPLVYYHEDQQIGVFYVQDIIRIGPTTYTISATSAIGILIEGLHYGGIYNGDTVAEILPGICGNVPYEVKSNLQGIALYGWLPVATPRDNLAQVLFAIGATVKTDLNGILRIEPLWDGVSGNIGVDQLFQGPSVSYASKITRVVVTEHQYTAGTEETDLFEGTTQTGDVITFSEPMHSLTASGFTITESGANYAVVTAGTGTLTGKKYIHNTRQVSRNVSPARSSEAENVKSVTDATLVSLVNSVSVAERLANYYGCLETISGDIVLDRQATGDVVNAYHPYDKEMVQACIESLDITASGILRATAKQLVGFKPISKEEAVYYDEFQVITTSQKFPIPAGVTSMRAVLIGGGTGAQAGKNGEPGTSGTDGYISSGQSGSREGSYGDGGAGGQGGVGGIGGKIFAVDLDVTDLSSITIQIGEGGIGGEANGAFGVAGSETKITVGDVSYSSEEGSSSPSGYTDTTTGKTYALTGSAGSPGGSGGRGGTESGHVADSGESLYGQSGGSRSGNFEDDGTVTGGEQTGPNVSQTERTTSDRTYAGPLIADINKRYTGNTGYSVDSKGYISLTGGRRTIGYDTGGNNSDVTFITGEVYSNPSNASPPSQGGSVHSTVHKVTVEDKSSGSIKSMRVIIGYVDVTRVYDWERYSVYWIAASLSSGGGGSAVGASGGNGSVGSNRSIGGNGASAGGPAQQTVPGSGGNGGNGGGGGGGGGSGYAYAEGDTSKVSKSVRGYGGQGGAGGAGSSGGTGANGCVLLYYGVPKIIKSGAIIGAEGKIRLDKYGRLMVG